MATHKDTRATDRRIAADIRARIMSGDLAPGEQLPITTKLIDQYEVANQTIQRALQILKAEGYIYGKSGQGVFVRDSTQHEIDTAATLPPSSSGEPYAWIAEASRQGTVGTNKILEVGEVVPPVKVREAFDLAEGEQVAMRKRVLLFDDEPAELCWSYYPLEIAVGTALMEPERIKGGSPTLLASLGFPSREAVDLVSWRPPTEEEFVLLELPAEVPVGRTFRVVYSDNQRPIEATVMIKAGHKHSLLYRTEIAPAN